MFLVSKYMLMNLSNLNIYIVFLYLSFVMTYLQTVRRDHLLILCKMHFIYSGVTKIMVLVAFVLV